MSDYVGTVLDWIESRLPRAPLAAAVARDLAPVVVGWAARHLLQDRTAKPTIAAGSRHESQVGRLKETWRNWAQPMSAFVSSPEPAPNNSWTGTAVILAICLQPNSTRAYLPVAVELRKLGLVTAFLLEASDTDSQRLVERESFASRLISQRLGWSELRSTATLIMRLRHLWSKRQELFALLDGLGLPHRLVDELSSTVRKTAISGAVRGNAIHRALLAAPAENVVFVTRRAYLNTILPHTHPNARRVFFLQGLVPDIPPIRTALEVDCAVIGSQMDLPYLRRCGVPLARISRVGYPDYDHFLGLQKPECRAEVASRLGLDSKRHWVLFTSQYRTPLFPHSARHRNLNAVLTAARMMPDVQFIIKLHPRNEIFNPSGLPRNVLLEKASDTSRLIKASDVLVTYWSTTALEALLLGTALVQLNTTGLPDFLRFPPELSVPVARSAEELVAQLVEALNRGVGPQTALLEKCLGPLPDGQAASRAAFAIQGAISASQRGSRE